MLIFSFICITVCRWTLNSMNYNLLLLFLTSGCPAVEYGKLLQACFCVIFDMSPSFSLIFASIWHRYLKLVLYFPILFGMENRILIPFMILFLGCYCSQWKGTREHGVCVYKTSSSHRSLHLEFRTTDSLLLFFLFNIYNFSSNSTPGSHILNVLSIYLSSFLLACQVLPTLFGLSILYARILSPLLTPSFSPGCVTPTTSCPIRQMLSFLAWHLIQN